MKRPARSGDIGRLEFVVTEEHAIDFSGDAMPAVLSTPWLIWFLEHAAREAMLPLLDAGESTVGRHGAIARVTTDGRQHGIGGDARFDAMSLGKG